MDHKPFPLYVIGERYSVFLSDVDEQVLSKLYKGRTDVVVRIKKTYDEEECLPVSYTHLTLPTIYSV